MSAISNKNKSQKGGGVLPLTESPEQILQRKRTVSALHSSDSSSSSSPEELPTGLRAEKPVGALCYLPKSLHRLASRAAEDRDITAKRFFLETLLLGLEQQNIITAEQRAEALLLPPDYGWRGRKAASDSSSSNN